MAAKSQHISVRINQPAALVYDFAADPANLPKWAAGLAGSTVEQHGEQWVTESPMGHVTFAFAPRNDLGVLDHNVTLPSGRTVYNPLRVIPDADGCEVVFTLRQLPEVSDAEFESDAASVRQDLATPKAAVESD